MKSSKSLLGMIIACLMIVLTAAAAARPQEPSRAPKKTLEGSWKVTVTPGPAPIPLPPAIESIITYAPGGGLIESDNLAVPGSIAGPGQGAWEFRDTRRFSLTFTKYLFLAQGQFQGAVRVTEQIGLGPGDSEYAGEGTMEILNPAGAVVYAVPLTTRAVRIRVGQP